MDLGSGRNARKTSCFVCSGRWFAAKRRTLWAGCCDRGPSWWRGCERGVVEQTNPQSPEETLPCDLLGVVADFSSRRYGTRSAARHAGIGVRLILRDTAEPCAHENT